jgi:hypothetical protein
MKPTPSSTPEEMCAYWKSLVEPDDPKVWGEDDLNWLFHYFRPDGKGVEAVFEGCVRGDEILPRLMEVYARTAEGSQGKNWIASYLDVRCPQPLVRGTTEVLVREHMKRVTALVEVFLDMSDPPDVPISDRLPLSFEVNVVEGVPPSERLEDENLTSVIYSHVIHLSSDLDWCYQHVDSHAFLLHEAFYYTSCDYLQKMHLMWPLYRELTDIEEPFAPYFELWKHGADYRFTDDHHVTVYVPNLIK